MSWRRLINSSLRKRHSIEYSNPPLLISSDAKIEEEGRQDYDLRRYYPVKLNQVFNGAYEIQFKLGFDTGSTVSLEALGSKCHAIY